MQNIWYLKTIEFLEEQKIQYNNRRNLHYQQNLYGILEYI